MKTNATKLLTNCLLLSSTLLLMLTPAKKTFAAKDISPAQISDSFVGQTNLQIENVDKFKSSILISQNEQLDYMPDYASSVGEAKDVMPTDESYGALQSAMARGRLIRLYNDNTFRGER
jgi:hypothetical protein